MHPIWSTISALFQQKGHSEYGGEAVTQLQHALQTASLAQKSGASDALITAALLHDIGHLLHDLPDDAPENGLDDFHENRAARFLETHFPPAVTEPIRLHVAAKRFLCSTEPAYLAALSFPSLQSLEMQGGPMKPTEITDFLANPFAPQAIQLRRWDDLAKDPTMQTTDLNFFSTAILSSAAVEF